MLKYFFYIYGIYKPYLDHSSVLCQHVVEFVIDLQQNNQQYLIMFRMNLEYLPNFAINYNAASKARNLATIVMKEKKL